MAVVHSITITPSRPGRLLVIVSYDVQLTTGSDWGPNPRSRIFCTQGGTTNADNLTMSATRQRHAAQATFNVSGGTPCTLGLDGSPGSPGSATWWNVSIQALLMKK